MLRERIVWIVALLLVGGAGYYTGNMLGVRAGEQNRAAAAQQFFASRGGGQNGGQAGAQGGFGGFGGAGRGNRVVGTVSAVDGNTITLTGQNGTATKVQLASGGAIRKQVDGQIGDVTSGEQVVATGTLNGDTFQATSIQVGGIGGGQGGRGAGQGAGQGGQNPASSMPAATATP